MLLDWCCELGRVSEALCKEVTVCLNQVWCNCSTHLPRRAEAPMPEAFLLLCLWLRVSFHVWVMM